MRQIFKAFRRRNDVASSQAQGRPNDLRPDAPFYAIGDIHGCDDLLARLLSRIDPEHDQQLIFLGDYVDRGPESAAVLARLFEMSQRFGNRIVCLRGNHERMMCQFIEDPLGKGARWLVNGGTETLKSFGITGIGRRPDADAAMEACDALEHAMPEGMIAWLETLPLSWQSGNVWCAHAAMDPAMPPDDQKSNTILWGHPTFLDTARPDDICVVHGHTIVPSPKNADSRISIDTGAYRTGVLTAAHISTEKCAFIQERG
ncbi:metallophosphoesterase family protein [Yoonia sp. 2307UL14-13]|uniref:metallophosphoesterase family protein n=1 Tax=Yoonia sp. 2307UL14-13 TaxID=3126506 RepID=UPI0030ACB926